MGDLNELQLAGAIGLSQSMLSQVRIGHRPLPTKAKIAVLDKLDYALTRNLVLSTLPGDVAGPSATPTTGGRRTGRG